MIGIEWQQVAGLASDVGVGADGSVWCIGTTPVGEAGDRGVYRWNGSDWELNASGGGVRISVGPDGTPYVVNVNGGILRLEGGNWTELPGRANDVGVGADGSVWCIGTRPTGTGADCGIYKWNGADWDEVPGGGCDIAVGPDGTPWVRNSSQEIYRLDAGTWVQVNGLANDVGVGADGSVWCVGTIADAGGGGTSVHRWNGTDWDQTETGGGVDISVAPDGSPWLVNAAGAIYHGVVAG